MLDSPLSSGGTAPDPPASWLARVFLQEDLNFLVTNRLPRGLATRFVGWLSHIESPVLTRALMAVWGLFSDDLRLHESPAEEYRSLHECFVRPLLPGVRAVDPTPDMLVSPCDGIVGASGVVTAGMALQAKGGAYPLRDLLGSDERAAGAEGWSYLTIRLKSNMYHRFHAPESAVLREVLYFSGDTWNVNPVALARVEALFCKNERALLAFERPDGRPAYWMVPVAAILVASIRIHALGETFHLRYRGPNRFACDERVSRGDELGYFHAGSTILLFIPPPLRLRQDLCVGHVVRMGEALFVPPEGAPHEAPREVDRPADVLRGAGPPALG